MEKDTDKEINIRVLVENEYQEAMEQIEQLVVVVLERYMQEERIIHLLLE